MLDEILVKRSGGLFHVFTTLKLEEIGEEKGSLSEHEKERYEIYDELRQERLLV